MQRDINVTVAAQQLAHFHGILDLRPSTPPVLPSGTSSTHLDPHYPLPVFRLLTVYLNPPAIQGQNHRRLGVSPNPDKRKDQLPFVRSRYGGPQRAGREPSLSVCEKLLAVSPPIQRVNHPRDLLVPLPLDT